jgi:prepilin-type N-terminal cleavage/methylation domain-containing protein
MSGRNLGFTLIEMVVSLILVAILSTVAGIGIITGLRGYFFARDNVTITQKAQLALTRVSRELMELTDITSVQMSPLLLVYERLANSAIVSQQLSHTGEHLRLNGDVVVDLVNGFTLTFYKGSQTWTAGVDDINLLSSIVVNLRMARPDGEEEMTFTATVCPRNNKNQGGVPPTVNPPAKSDYCFIATAAFGDPDHPAVWVLRAFRDRVLKRWALGRSIIRTYYRFGPSLAAWLERRPGARLLIRGCLMGVAGCVALWLFAPQAALAVMTLWGLLLTHRLVWKRRSRAGRRPGAEPCGGVMLGVVFTIVVLAMLGAAMLPLVTTSSFQQVGSGSSNKAYLLAESGFRVAASRYLNAGSSAARDQMLETLHGKTYTLSGTDGQFGLEVYPYFFKVVSTPVGTSLTARVMAGFPAGLSLSNGYVSIDSESGGNANATKYDSVSVAGSTLVFTKSGVNWSNHIQSGDTVHLASLPNGAQAINSSTHNYLDLEKATGSSTSFPLFNGAFSLKGARTGAGLLPASTVFLYEQRIDDGFGTLNRLSGIRLAANPSASLDADPVDVNGTTSVVLQRYIELQSTGTYDPGGFFETRRLVKYWTALPGLASSEKYTRTDTFEDRSRWVDLLGTFDVTETAGDMALRATILEDLEEAGQWGLIRFDWMRANADLVGAWEWGGNLLSYDLQVKVKATDGLSPEGPAPYFFAGLSFRLQRATDCSYGGAVCTYGVSFVRARQACEDLNGTCTWVNEIDVDENGTLVSRDVDGIPNALVPGDLFDDNVTALEQQTVGTPPMRFRYSLPAIVLWRRTIAGHRWLAYKTIVSGDHLLDDNVTQPRLVDWANLQVRVIEARPLPFREGRPAPLLHGDRIVGDGPKDIGRNNGTPVLDNGDWNASTAAGLLALTQLDDCATFTSGENVLEGGVLRAVADGPLGVRTNVIRVYYGDQATHGTPNSIAQDGSRAGNPRILGAQGVYWPVDNVGEWNPVSDHMTLVQWDEVNSAVELHGISPEENAIIVNGELTTPSSGFDNTYPEIGLHVAKAPDLGIAGDVDPQYFFDDFAIQLEGSSGGQGGYLLPIQQ